MAQFVEGLEAASLPARCCGVHGACLPHYAATPATIHLGGQTGYTAGYCLSGPRPSFLSSCYAFERDASQPAGLHQCVESSGSSPRLIHGSQCAHTSAGKVLLPRGLDVQKSSSSGHPGYASDSSIWPWSSNLSSCILCRRNHPASWCTHSRRPLHYSPM